MKRAVLLGGLKVHCQPNNSFAPVTVTLVPGVDYELAEPLKIPAGSKISGIGFYDNSPKNKWNPAPHLEVYWSEQSWDEMYVGFLDVSVDKRDLHLMRKTAAPPSTNGGR